MKQNQKTQQKDKGSLFSRVFGIAMVIVSLWVVVRFLGGYIYLHYDGRYAIGTITKVMDQDIDYEYYVGGKRYYGVAPNWKNEYNKGQRFLVIYSNSIRWLSIMVLSKPYKNGVNVETMKLDKGDITFDRF